MLEFWVNDAETVLDYIRAAQLFSYEYAVERLPRDRAWHITVYTDKFRAAAQEAATKAGV